MASFQPSFIKLPLSKMAGAPWNILDHRGFRIALCGTDGNHETDGEKIANDLLNLIAIGESVDELLEADFKRQERLERILLDAYNKIPQGEARQAVYANTLEAGLDLEKLQRKAREEE